VEDSVTDGQPILLRLLAVAFNHLAEMVPTVVGLAGEVPMPDLPWPRVEVEDAGQLVQVVNERLASAPLLVFPPWGYMPDQRQRQGEASGRTLAADGVLAEFRPAGPASVLGVVLPASTLTSERERSTREAMARMWHPAVVLYDMSGFPGVYTSLQVAVLLLVPRHRKVPTLMFRVLRENDPLSVETDFRKLLRNGTGRGQYGYVIQSPLPPGENLQFDRHDPAILERRADLAGYGSTVSLGQLFELLPLGVQWDSDRALSLDAGNDGAVRILTGQDIGRDGSILPPGDNTRWARLPDDRQLMAGDLILPRIFSPSDRGGLRIAEVTAVDLPAAASHSVIGLRPRDGLPAEQRLFVTLYLQSPLALALTYGTQLKGHIQLTRASLRELVSPLPDRALATALNHVLDAKERLERWRDDADALLRSVFLDEDSSNARARIVSAGRKLRLRVEEASLVDDFGQFVRMRFPYPIALRWRRVQAAAAADDPGHAYQEVLDAAEILLCYQAQLALAFSWEAGLNLGTVRGIRDRLKSGHGPTLGDWTAILGEVGESRAFRKLPKTHPLRDLRHMAASAEVAAAWNRLKSRRNDEAHQRRVDPVDMPAAVSSVLPDYTTLVEHAQFLADWPLAYVDSSRWDTFRHTAAVSYRPMMGDHPIVPPCRTTYPDSTLEPGSLYVIDSDDRWHLLRPFLIGRDCPECKTWSTFHADLDHGKLVIKSLEHGHTDDGQWLTEALQHVSLL
jgi:hypothetical protein